MRCEAAYSHLIPRRVQREQVGLSLLHLTLELAHPVQLSRSLGVDVLLNCRLWAGVDRAGWATAISAIVRLVTNAARRRV